MTTQPKRSLPPRHPHRPTRLVSCPVISMLSTTALLTRSPCSGTATTPLAAVRRCSVLIVLVRTTCGPLRRRRPPDEALPGEEHELRDRAGVFYCKRLELRR